MQDQICILVIEPHKRPYVMEIPDELERYQDLVGGNIEIVPFETDDGAVLIDNEDGKLLGLPGNRRLEFDVIVGTFFIAGSDGNRLVSLTEDQIRKYSDRFSEPEDISVQEINYFMSIQVFGFHDYIRKKRKTN